MHFTIRIHHSPSMVKKQTKHTTNCPYSSLNQILNLMLCSVWDKYKLFKIPKHLRNQWRSYACEGVNVCMCKYIFIHIRLFFFLSCKILEFSCKKKMYKQKLSPQGLRMLKIELAQLQECQDASLRCNPPPSSRCLLSTDLEDIGSSGATPEPLWTSCLSQG